MGGWQSAVPTVKHFATTAYTSVGQRGNLSSVDDKKSRGQPGRPLPKDGRRSFESSGLDG